MEEAVLEGLEEEQLLAEKTLLEVEIELELVLAGVAVFEDEVELDEDWLFVEEAELEDEQPVEDAINKQVSIWYLTSYFDEGTLTRQNTTPRSDACSARPLELRCAEANRP